LELATGEDTSIVGYLSIEDVRAPVLHFGSLFGWTEPPNLSRGKIVVVRDGLGPWGILVDRVWPVQQVSNLFPPPFLVPRARVYCRGIFRHGDESCFLLEPEHFRNAPSPAPAEKATRMVSSRLQPGPGVGASVGEKKLLLVALPKQSGSRP